uniref:Protein kinase domain-containing protein n=1 Tax=Acrobeloides nanus TaxID=290746 RepID=A0A914DKM1_9BILA
MATEFWTFMTYLTKEELVLTIRECWDDFLKQLEFSEDLQASDFIPISDEHREELPIFFKTVTSFVESGLKKLDQMSDEDFEIVKQVISEVGKLYQSDEIKCKENTDISFAALKAVEAEVEELNRKYRFNYNVYFLIAEVLAFLTGVSLNNAALIIQYIIQEFLWDNASLIISEFLWATICVLFLITSILAFYHFRIFITLVTQPSTKNIVSLMTSGYADAILDNVKRNIEKCNRDPVKLTKLLRPYMRTLLTPLQSMCYMNLLKRQERFGMFSKQFSNKNMVEFEEDIHRRFIEYIGKMLSIEDALEVCTKKQLALVHFSKNLLTHLQKYPFILNENGTCRELSQEDKDRIEPHLKSIDTFLYESTEFLLHMQAMKTDILNIDKSYISSTPFYTCNFPVYDPDDKDFLGRGSFGHVRKIEYGFTSEQGLNKHMAVKRLKLNAKKREKYIIDAYKMFYERSILDKLKHENIVNVIHAWIQYPYSESLQPITDDGFEMYVIMEFCDSSLKKYVKERGAIDENENLVIITDILKGLKFLHENQYIHRDIKPDNILIKKTKDRNIYVLGDFGSARRIPIKRLFSENMMKNDSDKTNDADEVDLFTLSKGSLGTHPYAAPEFKIKEQFYNDKVDIFSLGKIIELDLYGEEESLLPKNLEDFVKSMIHENPESRPSSEECLQFFSQFLPNTSRNELTQDDLENAPENEEESDDHENKLESLVKRIEERFTQDGFTNDDFPLLGLIDQRFCPIFIHLYEKRKT